MRGKEWSVTLIECIKPQYEGDEIGQRRGEYRRESVEGRLINISQFRRQQITSERTTSTSCCTSSLSGSIDRPLMLPRYPSHLPSISPPSPSPLSAIYFPSLLSYIFSGSGSYHPKLALANVLSDLLLL